MILLLTSDLMFQSRISGAARAASKECTVDRSVDKLVARISQPESVTLVLIDLTLNSVDLTLSIPQLNEVFVNAKVLAYGPHVDEERLRLALDSGADAVMTRGQFDRDLTSIIQGA